MAAILVVDDYEGSRELLQTLLSLRGHQVITAENGAEALAQIRAASIHLVITDVLMPVMDGYELVRQIRSEARTAATPVIFFTACYQQHEARALARACGVLRMLAKPAEPAEILQAVEEALASAAPSPTPPLDQEFDREHLRLVTDHLAREVSKLETANRKLGSLLERLQTLREIDRAILQAHSPEEIARAALTRLHRLVPCRSSAVLEFFPEEQEAQILAVSLEGSSRKPAGASGARSGEIPAPREGVRLPLGGAGVLARLQRNRLLRPGDLPPGSPLRELLQPDSGGAGILLSLVSQEELLGALYFEVDTIGSFPLEASDIAREVADSIAVAIQQARLFEQVRAGRERLRLLSGQLLRAQELERRAIAHELHDEIGQTLTVLKLNLQAMQRSPTAEPSARLDESLHLVDQTLRQVRDLSLDLRPSMLDDLGLQAALRWYLDRLAQRAGFTGHFLSGQFSASLPSDLQTICFRVAQEALTNVVRHAKARKVRVEVRPAGAELELTIQDDGQGFDVRAALTRAARGGSLGLLGLRERVTLLGGRVTIDSAPGRGTEIRAWLPLGVAVTDNALVPAEDAQLSGVRGSS